MLQQLKPVLSLTLSWLALAAQARTYERKRPSRPLRIHRGQVRKHSQRRRRWVGDPATTFYVSAYIAKALLLPQTEQNMDLPGFDPGTSPMLREHSTN